MAHSKTSSGWAPCRRRAAAWLQHTLRATSLPTGRQTAAVRYPKQGNTTVEEGPRLRFAEDKVSKKMTGTQLVLKRSPSISPKSSTVASQKESGCCCWCLITGTHCPPCHRQRYLLRCTFLACAGMQTDRVNLPRPLQ